MKTIAITLATLMLALSTVAPVMAAPFSYEGVWERALNKSER